ncbi:(R)-2-hydroxyglutaryl-CoA dehydratase subunit alpha [Peptoniphilus harei]|uniref:(R)-2-hydroxyglutaryl-CoA dehydratase subunit alpha n=1 Tax=Peptoniphilus harei TaxID=54005 RepID=A0A2X1X880_9FIRM|nr:(R)-2-hydroxyglutaryl-CoA dehydratase subunit alpha [Peptoniphilus harei]
MAKENGVSGALVNYNRSCKPWSGAMPEIERRWREDLEFQ